LRSKILFPVNHLFFFDFFIDFFVPFDVGRMLGRNPRRISPPSPEFQLLLVFLLFLFILKHAPPSTESRDLRKRISVGFSSTPPLVCSPSPFHVVLTSLPARHFVSVSAIPVSFPLFKFLYRGLLGLPSNHNVSSELIDFPRLGGFCAGDPKQQFLPRTA